MPLSKLQKQKLHELELNKGGVAFFQQRTSAKPNPTIIISLGGLGGKTLNMLKGKFINEIGECDHIYFRMIDTDKKDTDQLCKIMSNGETNPISGAYMDSQECISLYDPQIDKLLLDENIPQHISEWLNPALKGTLLDNNGAKQIRQIGRAMYSADVVYNNVRDRLRTVINDAVGKANSTNEDIDVIILAGVSGGTGSGTIIDIPYLIHDIFRDLGFHNYHIAGYIFTPDAQFNEQGIKGNNAILLNLRRNGYAALKEIDLFMNSEATETNYTLNLSASSINIRKNIFSTCTLVSGYSQIGGINDLNVTLGRLTDQLMDMLTNITFIDSANNPVQLAKSLMSNEDSMLSSWFNIHRDRKQYHRYASYKYQVLGYTSIRIPRDEILAYCVNKIYEQVIGEFNDFKNLDKQLMDTIYAACHIQDKANLKQYAKTINKANPIQTFNSLDDTITKKMIKNDPLIAYKMAVEIAEDEAKKCQVPSFEKAIEDELYEALKYQVEQISNKYGPYMAIEAITHTRAKTSVGNPDEPFPGIVEQLVDLAQEIDLDANKAMSTERSGQRKLQKLAEGASSGIFTDHDAIDEYVSKSCMLACITRINTSLLPVISQALKNVARRLNEYNNTIFEVYTSILDEISYILNQDGQYLTKGVSTTIDGVNYYQLDILESGEAKKERLENYLNDFISKVDVDELARNFIKKMRNNRDKWIEATNTEDFDVVNEVRSLMDECLEKNNLKNEIIEKFITVAYSPRNLTPDELNAIWNDNSEDGLKMQALRTAANEIYTLLHTESRTLAQSASIGFETYTKTIYVGTLKDAPQLSSIINELVLNEGNKPATSTAKNKFIMTTQYVSLPMYILQGMSEYNEVYVKNTTNGKHMDENRQDWALFPNPYTIDSVAKDLKAKKINLEKLKEYPDYNILVDIKNKVDYAIDELGSATINDSLNGHSSITLLRVDGKPYDLTEFKDQLTKALKTDENLDYIEFMKNNGYVITEIVVNSNNVDIDFSRRDLNNLSTYEDIISYTDVPVPIADLYKWIRKSPNYMNIINESNPVFEEVYKMKEEIKDSFKEARRYVDNVEIFAHALMCDMIKMKNNNVLIWNFMDGNDPVTVNLLASKKFDKKYYLYHVFVRFNQLSAKRLQEYGAKSLRKINDGYVSEDTTVRDHVEEMMSDDYLGDLFNTDLINEEADEQGVSKNYTVTDRDEDQGNAYKVLKRFYKLLSDSL